jgi:membrane-bound lytic murein transglycosylase F
MVQQTHISYAFLKMLPALVMLIVMIFIACGRVSVSDEETEMELVSSLDVVLHRGRLIAITDYNTVNYYIFRGEPMGFQYEMLKQFTDHIGVGLEIRIMDNLPKSFEALNSGKADLIALGLTVTRERQHEFDFTDPIIVTRQVLVQGLPNNWQRMATRDEIENSLLRSSLDLAGQTIHVQKGTIFRQRLETLSNEIGDTIYIVEDKREVEELISAVASGEIMFTVADEHIALVNARYHTNIDVRTPLSFPQRLAWALRKESDNELKNEINEWLSGYNTTLHARLIHDKYFRSPLQRRMAQSEFHSLTGGRLSVYDETIREVAQEINWDWRLLASLIYQESGFRPEAVSWAGAYGLMQFMPIVMEQFGIDTTATPEEQIRVGGRFINYLDRQIPASVTDSVERIKFVLASYNAGVGHVLDARRLAQKFNKSPDIWTNHVDFFMLNKSKPSFYRDPVVYYGYARGEETFKFVIEIFERFEHYRNLIPE